MGWIHIESEPTQHPEGGYLWNGVISDITEQKQTELALHESERKFRDIMENVNLISVNLDINGNITFANDYFLKLTGWQREEILGRNWFELFIPPEIELKQLLYQGIMEGILPTHHQNEILTRTGEHRLIDWSNTLLRDNQGNIGGVSGIGIDVTEQKKVETALKESEAKLKELNAEKDKFFSIIAHDLRSPFNAFLGFTRLLVEELDTLSIKELQKIALSMRNSASNVFRLLENLLEWSRMQQGKIIFSPESTLLMPLISDSISPVMDSANNKGIEISYEIPASLEVFADEYMLASTIRNLVSNAVKFSRKGDTVTIVAKPVPGNSVEISIRDSGIGMSRTMVDELFRLDVQTNRKGTDGEPSAGLGLLLCKDFIEKHGGKLWVESEEGKGSVFFFTIPEKNSLS